METQNNTSGQHLLDERGYFDKLKLNKEMQGVLSFAIENDSELVESLVDPSKRITAANLPKIWKWLSDSGYLESLGALYYYMKYEGDTSNSDSDIARALIPETLIFLGINEEEKRYTFNLEAIERSLFG